MVNYSILQQFVTFCETGTLRETAKKLHISQPTLTRNMQKLEAEFDVPLFIRSKNSISLNETGLVAAEDAKILLRQTEIMLRHACDFDRTNKAITLGACTPIPVPNLVRCITAACPMVTIFSEIKSISQLLDGIKNGTYQFVLLPFCPDDKELYCIKWGEEHLSFLLPKRHRFARRKSLSISEMNGENMLLFQDIGFWYNLVVEKMPDSRFLIQTDSYTFLELINNSTMSTFATDFFCDTFPDVLPASGRLAVPIADPEFNVNYYLVSTKANQDKLKAIFQ